MADLSHVAAFILNIFVETWDFLFYRADWLGIVVTGFVVLRVIIYAIGFLLARRGNDK